jgi:tRNA A-37 threonylcarbamoyl transferase component Bud32
MHPFNNTDDQKISTGYGKYAMSKSEGVPFHYIEDDLTDENGEPKDPERRMKILKKILRARRDINRSGVAHQDMHMNNVLVDPDNDDNISVVDFGVSGTHPDQALLEAFGTFSGADNRFKSFRNEFDEEFQSAL